MMGRLDEARAFRQKLLAGLISFVAFGVGFFALSGYLIVRYVLPEASWWQAAHLTAHAIYWSFIVGLFGTLVVVAGLDRWHHACGVYRCHHCGAVLRSWRVPCGCATPEVRALHGPRTLIGEIVAELRPAAQRMLPMLLWVLLTYLLLIPIDYAAIRLLRHPPNPEPRWFDWVIGHMCLSLLLGLACGLSASSLELFKVATEFRQRLERLGIMFGLWPAVGFLIGSALKLLGWF